MPEETINNLLKISSTIQEKLNNLNEEEKSRYANQGEFYSEMMEQEFETRNLDTDMRELGRDFMCWFSKLQANIDGSDSLYNNSLEQEFVYQVSFSYPHTTIYKICICTSSLSWQYTVIGNSI